MQATSGHRPEAYILLLGNMTNEADKYIFTPALDSLSFIAMDLFVFSLSGS